jgi:hypothetical protein
LANVELTLIVVDLKNLNDTMRNNTVVSTDAAGGADDDELQGSFTASDTLKGGGGHDRLLSG